MAPGAMTSSEDHKAVARKRGPFDWAIRVLCLAYSKDAGHVVRIVGSGLVAWTELGG